MKRFSKNNLFKNGTSKDVRWSIKVENKWWNESERRWTDYTPDIDLSSTNGGYRGKMSPRKVARLVRGWNLPSGTVMRFLGVYHWRGKVAVIPAEMFEIVING